MKEICINVDSYNSDSIKTIQGNNNAEVYKIYVLFNKRRIDLTGKTVKMAYLRTGTVEGDVINLNVTNATEGEITLQITNSISKRDGVYSCQLAIYGADGFLEHTATFGLTVEANIFNQIANEIANSKDLTYIESILEEAINTSEELKSNIPVARQLNIDLLNKNGTLNETMEKANVVNNTLADTTEKSKVAATEAIEKKSDLESSIVEAKKFIDGLDGSQNIPQIRLDVTELQNGLKSNQALEYSGSSISANDTLEGRTEGMKIGGRTLLNNVGEYISHAGCNYSNKKISINGSPANDGYSINFKSRNIDINKQYILGVFIETMNDNAKTLGLSMGILDNTNAAWNKVESINSPTLGWNFVDLTIDKNKTIGNLRFRNCKPPTNLHLEAVITNFIMIEKCDKFSFINKPYYFEDIKSFGEAEYNYLDESQISIGYIGGSDGITYTIPGQDDGTRIAIIPCDPNTTYTITKEFITDRFIVGTTTEKPIHAMKVNKLSQQDNSKSITITTPGDGEYLLAYLTLDNKNKPCGKVNINKSNVPVEWSVPGKYNISILSHNKNLINFKKVLNDLSVNYSLIDGIYTFNTDNVLFSRGVFTINDKQKTYTVSCKVKLKTASNFRIDMVYSDGFNPSNMCDSTDNFVELKITSNPARQLKYIRFNYSTPGEISIKDFQIEINENKTKYEDYKEDKKDILIKEPLRENDVMYEDNGQVKVYREANQYTFTGDENIVYVENINNLYKYYLVMDNLNPTSIIANYPVSTVSNDWINATRKCILVSDSISATKNRLYIVSDLQLEQFKAELKSNPLTVIYQLAEPVTEIVEGIDIDLDTFQDKTYFNILNSLPGTLDFKVPSNIGSLVQSNAKEINNINEFINKFVLKALLEINKDLAVIKIKNGLK